MSVFDFIQAKLWTNVLEICKDHPDSINKKQNGSTPLHFAFIYQAPKNVILSLIMCQPEAAAVVDRDRCLPLHLSLVKPDFLITESLLYAFAAGAAVRDGDGNLPLHIALKFSASLEIIEKIVEYNKQGPSEKSKAGDYAIHIACRHSASLQIIQRLLDAFPLGI